MSASTVHPTEDRIDVRTIDLHRATFVCWRTAGSPQIRMLRDNEPVRVEFYHDGRRASVSGGGTWTKDGGGYWWPVVQGDPFAVPETPEQLAAWEAVQAAERYQRQLAAERAAESDLPRLPIRSDLVGAGRRLWTR